MFYITPLFATSAENREKVVKVVKDLCLIFMKLLYGRPAWRAVGFSGNLLPCLLTIFALLNVVQRTVTNKYDLLIEHLKYSRQNIKFPTDHSDKQSVKPGYSWCSKSSPCSRMYVRRHAVSAWCISWLNTSSSSASTFWAVRLLNPMLGLWLTVLVWAIFFTGHL